MAADNTGRENKQPHRIPNYPGNGQRVYLFSKQVSSTDLRLGLRLTGFATTYLDELPPQYLSAIHGNGLKVACYTPAGQSHDIMLEHTNPGGAPIYRFSGNGWQEIASANGWCKHHPIDCWVVFEPIRGMLSFLIE
ncbi:hypothetical protein CRG98_011040 [Punica granatum]|uniref:TF-B3 domain-containing protein n=1 Tax=Punica granatum TaxID=22663 RepID=A0A2I0KJ78_PUNGR|nr:hypothetical protein CRG98_011040 [Punica granatum]